MKILLAADGSAYTQKMLTYLCSHPELLVESRQYTALTVQAPLPPRARSLVSKADVDAYYAEESDKVLNTVTETMAKHGVTVERASKIGSAGEEIAKFAENGQFDLIIMGSHGQGSFSNLVMGSVATKVLAACKVPVLLIR
jgi:nucleotide-binding universal stress UspA family protein